MSDKTLDPQDEALEQAFKGALLRQDDFKSRYLESEYTAGNQSLLHKIITPITDNESYRQELKTALWASSDEADEAVAALHECMYLGMDPTPIVDTIISRSAGKNQSLVGRILETLTHTSFTTNYKKDDKTNGKSKNSPLP